MPVNNPLTALKGATAIGADPGPHPESDWLGTAIQGLLGAIGLGDDSSQANRGGQLIGAAFPFLGKVNPMFTALGEEGALNAGRPAPLSSNLDEAIYQRMLKSGAGNNQPRKIGNSLEPHPAVRALMDTLSGQPESLDPVKVFAGEKLGGFEVPHRSLITPPEGFELPEGTSPYPARDPSLIDAYTQRRDSGLYRSSDYRTNGSKPTSALKGLPKKAGVKVDPGAEFDSKFAVSGLGDWK